MKKQIISIVAMLTLIAAPALAGVWTAQSSSGGSGGVGCYIINFNADSYGARQLFGNGLVSGNTFSGLLKKATTSNSQDPIECGAGGGCAWSNAGYDGYSSYPVYHVVSVSGLPITSSRIISCAHW